MVTGPAREAAKLLAILQERREHLERWHKSLIRRLRGKSEAHRHILRGEIAVVRAEIADVTAALVEAHRQLASANRSAELTKLRAA